MADFLKIEEKIKNISIDLNLNYLLSDSFEINNVSQNWNTDDIYLVNDFGLFDVESTHHTGGQIESKMNFVLILAKNFKSSATQEHKKIIYNELFNKAIEFMYNFNSPNDLTLFVSNWRSKKVNLTANSFLGINIFLPIKTTCNR